MTGKASMANLLLLAVLLITKMQTVSSFLSGSTFVTAPTSFGRSTFLAPSLSSRHVPFFIKV
jgi:hypothetical protein